MSDPLTDDLNALRITREEPVRSRDRGPGVLSRVVGPLVVVAALGVGAAWAYPRIAAQVFKTEVRVAEISRVSPVQAATSVTATGYVIAETLSRVSPRVPGRIARMLVHEGDRVTAGQTLYELDAADQRSALAAAQARVLAAEARVAVARANLAEARVLADRQRRLAASGAAARSNVEDLDARIVPLEAAVTAALAEVRSLSADVGVARAALGTLVLHAPFAGTVINRPPQPGEVVGTEVRAVEIADLASQVVEVDVPEGRLSLVRPGGPCEIVLDAFAGRRMRGIVRDIGHRIDRAKATVPVRVRFAESLDGVLPEMSARVSFLTAEPTAEALRDAGHVVVPAGAVVPRGGVSVVFVVEEGVVHRVPVRTGNPVGGDVELVEGPPVGARVVLAPPSSLREGSPVKEVAR